MSEINEILKERGQTHGDFKLVAECYTNFRRSFDICGFRQDGITRLGLDAILMKLARIACGDSSFVDHWRDIEGYAKLVADELEAKEMINDFR